MSPAGKERNTFIYNRESFTAITSFMYWRVNIERHHNIEETFFLKKLLSTCVIIVLLLCESHRERAELSICSQNGCVVALLQAK